MKPTFLNLILTVSVLAIATWGLPACAQEGATGVPKAIPKTRSETKKLLQELKYRAPRLPIPDAVPTANGNSAGSSVINSRARRYYLPEAWLLAERWGNELESRVSYEIKTQCFWVVSRGNNCHYCLGHQEHKLKSAGLSDDQIGALDRNWDLLDPRTRKAVELAKKMTVLPFAISDQDVASLKTDYSDSQIVELVYSIARFNSMNRWTDSMGLPQDPQMRGELIEFDSPTQERWDQGESLLVAGTDNLRPDPWNWDECQSQIQIAANRTPRVSLASRDQAAEIFNMEPSSISDWHRAMATLPAAGPEIIRAWTQVFSDPELDPKIKAAICWTTARCNRTAGSLSMARKLAAQLGVSDQEMQQWDSKEPGNLPVGIAKAIAFADKVTCLPTKITDQDIAELRHEFSERQTAHLIYTAATANALDRITETLSLSVIR